MKEGPGPAEAPLTPDPTEMMVPRFAAPAGPDDDLSTDPTIGSQNGSPTGFRPGGARPAMTTGSQNDRHIPMDISSGSSADLGATAKILAGLIGTAVVVAGLMLRRTGRQLRRPTNDQIHDFAVPVTSILARYVPVERLSPTLVDLGAAGGVLSEYLLDGPVIEHDDRVSWLTPSEDPADQTPPSNGTVPDWAVPASPGMGAPPARDPKANVTELQ